MQRARQILLAAGVALLGLFISACQPAPATSAAPDGVWVSLFNGRDLIDWTPKFRGEPLGVNFLDTFRVEDGLLTVSYENHRAWDRRYGHLFYSVRPYSHYWLRAEYRFTGEQVAGGPSWAWRNNGLMLHAQPPETMSLDQDFPVSIETRLLGEAAYHRLTGYEWDPEWSRLTRLERRLFGGTLFAARPNGDVCTPYTSVLYRGERSAEQCVESSYGTNRGDGWVLVEVEVQGSEIVRQYVNGELAMEFTDLRVDEPHPWLTGLELGSGYIAIQAESHPTQFRRIELLDLGETE